MKKATSVITYLLILAAWAFCPALADAAEAQLQSFSLEGQDGATYTEQSWPDQTLVLFMSTRESAVYNEGQVWSTPIAESFSNPGLSQRVALVRIANLSSVPRLFRGASKSMIQGMLAPAAGDPLHLSLLDWDGALSEHYGLASDAYNIMVFRHSGQLLYQTSLREFSQQQLDTVLAELTSLHSQL